MAAEVDTGGAPATLITSDDWCTPAAIANAIGPVDLDPCSNPRSHIQADQRVMLPDDGLVVPWFSKAVFVNPPYSAPLLWCRKAVLSVEDDANVALLLKLDTTTKWWAVLVGSRRQRVYPFRKRIPFEQPGKTMVANFASVLVVLQKGPRSYFDPAVAQLREEGWIW